MQAERARVANEIERARREYEWSLNDALVMSALSRLTNPWWKFWGSK